MVRSVPDSEQAFSWLWLEAPRHLSVVLLQSVFQRTNIDTPELYQKLMSNGYARSFVKICIKPTAVPDPLAVIATIVNSDPLRNKGTYRFEDAHGDYVEVNIHSHDVKANLGKHGVSRLAFLPRIPNYQYYLFYLDTYTTMDLSYLATLPLESLISVRVDRFPSKEVQQKLHALNANRRWHEISVQIYEKSSWNYGN